MRTTRERGGERQTDSTNKVVIPHPNFMPTNPPNFSKVRQKFEECREVQAVSSGVQHLWRDPLSLMSIVSCLLWQWRMWKDRSEAGRFTFKAQLLSELNNRRLGQNSLCPKTDSSPHKSTHQSQTIESLLSERTFKSQYVRIGHLLKSGSKQIGDSTSPPLTAANCSFH